MKARSPWLFVPVFMMLILFAFSSWLLNRNSVYARQNRELLLQNDSVMSVNLDLMNELDRLKKARKP